MREVVGGMYKSRDAEWTAEEDWNERDISTQFRVTCKGWNAGEIETSGGTIPATDILLSLWHPSTQVETVTECVKCDA
jgi:hypothetical protein